MYFKKLVGKLCYLSPIDVADAEKYTAWVNDLEVTTNLTLASKNITLEGEKELLNHLAKEHTYAIIDLERNDLIGNVGLLNINHIHQTAEIGIFIGDKSYWNRGYGAEAMSLLIDYAFNVLNLHNIMLRVFSFNERGIKCYKKIGFKEVGLIREAHRINREVHDILLMDLLPSEFYEQATGK
jgi:RimJ/RimL family protein N-acetyltransferase